MSANFIPPPVETGVLDNPGTMSNPMDSLDSEAFLKLFVAQLRFQNPMEPAGGTEMMLQTAQFTQVEMLTQLLEAQQASMGMAQMSTASSLIGQQVTATLPEGDVTGVVDGFHVGDEGPVLHVAGANVPLELVSNIGSQTSPYGA